VELSVFQVNAIVEGYCYECSCGELYRSVGLAIECRKCRVYNPQWGYCTEVYDIAIGEQVYESPVIRHERERLEREAQRAADAVEAFTLGARCPGLAQMVAA
jgi:hypothetical protein